MEIGLDTLALVVYRIDLIAASIFFDAPYRLLLFLGILFRV